MIIRAEYKCGNHAMPHMNSNQYSSSIWKVICKNQPDVTSSISCWVINGGTDVRFWKDNWIASNVPLQEIVTQLIYPSQVNVHVACYAPNGVWN